MIWNIENSEKYVFYNLLILIARKVFDVKHIEITVYTYRHTHGKNN